VTTLGRHATSGVGSTSRLFDGRRRGRFLEAHCKTLEQMSRVTGPWNFCWWLWYLMPLSRRYCLLFNRINGSENQHLCACKMYIIYIYVIMCVYNLDACYHCCILYHIIILYHVILYYIILYYILYYDIILYIYDDMVLRIDTYQLFHIH